MSGPVRRGVLAALALGYASFAGCGALAESDDDASVPDADAGAAFDASSDAIDDASDAGPDALATDGAADAPSDALHGFKFLCTDGDQCDAAAPACCATLNFEPNCVLENIVASCTLASACTTDLQPFCGGAETVRLCDKNADCTEPGYDRCCTFDIQSTQTSLVMCASQAEAEAADASCVP